MRPVHERRQPALDDSLEIVLALATAFFAGPSTAQDIGNADAERLTDLPKRGYSPC
jgi:hypothetical protein